MALPFLALLGLGGLAAVAVVAFWDEIVDWLKQIVPAIKNFFRKIAHATAAFVQKVKAKIAKIMHRVYYKEDNKWIEQTTTREIPESELPASVRRKMMSTRENEVTEELQEMGLEV